VPGWGDANEKIVPGEMNRSFRVFVGHLLTVNAKNQQKNNMVVFKTQMDGVDTVRCNQIARLKQFGKVLAATFAGS